MKNSHTLVRFLVGLLLAFGIFLFITRKLKKKSAIDYVVLKSKYRNLYPYILAQARHESNDFTSQLYLRQHNMFGMKDASVRKQLGMDVENDDYRAYKSDTESVADFLLYLDHFKFPENVTSIDSYVNILDGFGYFEDSKQNYLNALKKWL